MKEEKCDLLIQARLDSGRLPRKVLLPLFGKPLLDFVVERCLRAQRVRQVILVTTEKKSDDPLIAYCEKRDLPYFRGSQEDVLDRFVQAARQFDSQWIVRITADCPLIDPDLIDEMIDQFSAKQPLDYINTDQEHSLPRGLDVEIFSRAAGEKAHQRCQDPAEREHVTLFFKRNPDLFSLFTYHHNCNFAHYRVTVDTREDFSLVQSVLEGLYFAHPHFSMYELFDFLDKHPEIVRKNRWIQQKIP